MIRKHVLSGVLVAAVLLAVVPVSSLAGPGLSWSVQEGVNLLVNPGFEDGFGAWNPPDCPNCPWGVSCNWGICYTAQVSAYWIPFWKNCPEGDSSCALRMPEYKPATAPYYDRIHGGASAQQYFSFYGTHDAGLFQTVTGLDPGATVAFSAYAQGWSSNDGDNKSDDPLDNIVFRVGIDPNGGIDPWSSSVVWSPFIASPDIYSFVGPAEAQVGAEGKVTVFMHSVVQYWPFMNNDAYWDDASLVYTTPPATPTDTPPPPPPTATPGPSPTPLPTSTPRPDGATVHVVSEGDTLFGIALMYGVDADQIRQLNAGSIGSSDMIWPGQELVISLPSVTPTPTPLPALPTPVPTTAPEGAEVVAEAGGAIICVLAYHDRNGDTFRDAETEELLPNVEFAVADTSGVIDRYVSDGISEPHCFTGLAPGAYRVFQTPPPGYESSGPAEWPVALAEGNRFDLQFGNVRSEDAEAIAEVPTTAPEDEEGGGSGAVGTVFATVARISGILVLILAMGVAVLFFLNRRRM